MSDHWKEQFDSSKHLDRMWGPGCAAETTRDQRLDPRLVYFVRTCGFTFEFQSMDQLDTCLRYFSLKVRSSSRLPWGELSGGDQTETQRWFDRLPQWLLKETKRLRVVKALEKASASFSGSPANKAMQQTGLRVAADRPNRSVEDA